LHRPNASSHFSAGALLSAFALLGPLSAADRPPTYHGAIAKVFRERCVACHGGEEPKSKLSLEALDSVKAGGKKGAAIVPGKPGESLLFKLITGAAKPAMPPKKEGPLAAEEVEVIRAWIEAGCPEGEPVAEPKPYSRRLEPPTYARPGSVTALAYGADGERLFVAGYREILVHRAEAAPDAAGRGERGVYPEARLLGEAEQIHVLQTAPGGGLLLAAGGSPSRFGELQLWDVAAGKLVRFLRLGRDVIYAASFSSNGERIAVGGTDRRVRVIETASGKELISSEVHSDWILGVAFGAEDSRIASAGRDKTVKISAAASGEFLQNLSTLEGPVFRLIARPGSNHFLAAGESNKPALYDAKDLKRVREFEDQPGAVLAAAFSADGKLLALGGSGGEVRVYRTDDGNRAQSSNVPEGWTYALAFRPDGERIAAAGYDGCVRILGVKDGKEARAFLPFPIGIFRKF